MCVWCLCVCVCMVFVCVCVYVCVCVFSVLPGCCVEEIVAYETVPSESIMRDLTHVFTGEVISVCF